MYKFEFDARTKKVLVKCDDKIIVDEVFDSDEEEPFFLGMEFRLWVEQKKSEYGIDVCDIRIRLL